jgi:hypothetical protein
MLEAKLGIKGPSDKRNRRLASGLERIGVGAKLDDFFADLDEMEKRLDGSA